MTIDAPIDAVPPRAPLPPLTTLKAVHSLPLAEARRGYPVHANAIITFYDP